MPWVIFVISTVCFFGSCWLFRQIKRPIRWLLPVVAYASAYFAFYFLLDALGMTEDPQSYDTNWNTVAKQYGLIVALPLTAWWYFMSSLFD